MYLTVLERYLEITQDEWDWISLQEQDKILYDVSKITRSILVPPDVPMPGLQATINRAHNLVIFEYTLALALRGGRHDGLRHCHVGGQEIFRNTFFRVLDPLLTESPDWLVLSPRQRHGLVTRLKSGLKGIMVSEHRVKPRVFQECYRRTLETLLVSEHVPKMAP